MQQLTRRAFFATLLALRAGKAEEEEPSCENFEFVWEQAATEANALPLGKSLYKRFKGVLHSITITKIKTGGEQATVFARCEN